MTRPYNKLSTLPNQPDFIFIGVRADGTEVECAVQYDSTSQQHTVVDTKNKQPQFDNLVMWKHRFDFPRNRPT